jgi:hypothetical protein
VGFHHRSGPGSHRQHMVTCRRLLIRCRRRLRLLVGSIRFRVDSDRRAERLVSWTHGGMSYSGNLIRRIIISRPTVCEAVQKPPHRAICFGSGTSSKRCRRTVNSQDDAVRYPVSGRSLTSEQNQRCECHFKGRKCTVNLY